MVRVIKDVKRVIVHPTNVTMLSPEKYRIVPREDWNVVIEDAKQVQTNANDVENKTILFMDDKVMCRVDQEEKTVVCGKQPHDVKEMKFTASLDTYGRD